jgi:hypothetical protein
MRVMVIVKADKNSEAGILPDEKVFAAMGKFNEELINAGVMLAAEGLQPTSKGVRVRFTGKNPTVIDGPFAESKELIAGFWLWKVNSMEDAVNWLKRSPFQDTEVEIRRIYEMEDFGDAVSQERKDRKRLLREQYEEVSKSGTK